jgi:hypothetical protein
MRTDRVGGIDRKLGFEAHVQGVAAHDEFVSRASRPAPGLHCARSLEPASPAVPTAAPDKQHYDDNDQKGCGVHIVLPGVHSGPGPAHTAVTLSLN